MAFALPSRVVETEKASSLMTPSFDAGVDTAAELVRLISRVAVWPEVTLSVSFTVL